MHAQASLSDYGQVLAQLGGAAAGQDGDEFFVRIEVLLTAESMAIKRRVHGADQRMADELHGYSGIAIEFFFKRKNAQCLREAPAHYAHAPRPPGPELRADVVDVFNATAFEFAGEAQVEAGKIGEDRKGGLAALGLADEATHGANERRQMAEDFGDASDGDFGVVGDDVDAGGTHLRATHAEDFEVGALL